LADSLRPAVPDAPEGFGTRLAHAFEDFGQLCVGIDPHAYLLDRWGLPDSADGAREFGLRVVDAASGSVGIVKPQVAFFERFGSAGFSALEAVLRSARAAGLLVIADAKRGDLGTTVEAYGQTWLSPGGPLEADALTIHAYMGVGSIEAPMALAERHGKGLFVLAATSNPEGIGVQTARVSVGNHVGQTVASSIVSDVGQWNASRDRPPARSIGSIGLVLGATVDFEAFGIDLSAVAATPASPVLAPGFGHQGAQFRDLHDLYGPAAPYAVVSASRSILTAGPAGVAEAIRVQAAEVFACRA
jgi:orotidine-5'-phosphate decarboxylase